MSSLAEAAAPWYADQVLPFDVTLCGTNEMGAATAMRIFGVEILNSGNGTSIDDTVNESQATFVARFVEPWQAVALISSIACCRRASARAAARRTVGLFVLPGPKYPRAGTDLKPGGPSSHTASFIKAGQQGRARPMRTIRPATSPA